MWPFKKKIKPLNNAVLLKYRHEDLGRLRFIGQWSGWWETRIEPQPRGRAGLNVLYWH